MSEDREFPGVDRLRYFLAQIVVVAAVVLLVTIFGPDSFVVRNLGLPLLVVGFVLDVMRLRNIGASQWFAMLRFLPLGRLVLSIGLYCAQPGWAATRRLDPAGRSILFVELLLLALILFLNYRSPAFSYFY